MDNRVKKMKIHDSLDSKTLRQTDLPLISIIIPTFFRPKGLETAFLSAASQKITDYNIEIIVADNSPDADAQFQALKLFEATDLEAKYISVPQPGVANVRNAALKISSGEFIAFLDDDQEATQNWLSSMIKQIKKDESCVVFSRIEGRSDQTSHNITPKLDFFSRRHEHKPSGLTEKFYGCGASLINLSLIDPKLIDFDPARNQTGGEDDAFFSAIQHTGGTFSWSKEAFVYEDVPLQRLRKRYICQRSFAFGQGPSRLSIEPKNYSLPELIKWMIIGVIQMAVYAPLAFISWPFENAFHMKYLRKSCEGAGKFFWQKAFTPKFYGQAAADRKTAKALKT